MKPIVTLFAAMLFTMTFQAQVGIGTTTPQAALDIVSATDGLLIPRVALTAENISLPVLTPTEGELVFNTNVIGTLTQGFYYWSIAGNIWVRIGDTVTPPPPPPSFGGWLLAGNAAVAADFIGTTNNVDLLFRRAGVLSGRLGETNTFYGRLAGGSINNGSFNTYIGRNAGALLNTTAQNNTAIGFNALQSQNGRASSQNTAIGAKALENARGDNNTAIGNLAGATNTGSNNVIIGNLASIGSGSNSVAIGNGANSGAWSNSVAIGSGATNTAANQIQLGNGTIGSARVQVGWTITSDRRFKSDIKTSELGLDFIKTIRPVSYYRNIDKNKKTEYGFIAQELEQALINAGDANNAIILKDDAGMYGVRYNDFIPMTIKAVQEQQTQIEALQKQNAELIKTNAAFLKRLEALENKN